MKLIKKLHWAIIEFLAHRVAPCQHISHLQSESRDRKLRARERLTVSSHLLVCDWCTQFGKQITAIDRALNVAADHPEKLIGDDSGLSDSAKQRIRDRLASNN